ncbi:Helix-turn-helix domain protein [Caloramator mitchellensis]|uniref:Helix-turn-helix domain protein n=1 Tax=Caloramator mitchellensis TaxID=908809 RepID=A0A0R3JXQ3_CALMK|nr:helix-turn-helix domain-containing protein [Caloramator mitchellensis]KRQ87117.1 Helix-turn-helix domain protein [Caloramator mitchellensis]
MENKNSKLFYSIILLSICLLISSLVVSYTALNISKQFAYRESRYNKELLTLSEASEYLSISEEDIMDIIATEEKILHEQSVFTGRMFPYIRINSKLYFSKDLIDEWIKEATGKSYDTKKRTILR